MSLSKHQKLFLVLSFMIHWNLIQFVEVVRMMTLIYARAMFWDWFGQLFVFLVFGCNWHWWWGKASGQWNLFFLIWKVEYPICILVQFFVVSLMFCFWLWLMFKSHIERKNILVWNVIYLNVNFFNVHYTRDSMIG